MMLHSGPVLHLTRIGFANRALQSIYVVIIVAVTVAAGVGISAFSSPFLHPVIRGSSAAITVTSAQPSGALPFRYVERVESLQGVHAVRYSASALITCQPSQPAVSILGRGGPGTYEVVHSLGVNSRTQQAWRDVPQGVLVGSEVAKSCGWEAGTIVSPPNTWTGVPIELHVIAVFPYNKRTPGLNKVVFAHYRYISRVSVHNTDHVNAIMLKSNTPRSAPRLAARIESAFAHDDPPVDAETDSLIQNSLARFGQAQYVLALTMLAISLCAMLVLVSVFAHEAVERRPRMAMLQVLGFQRAQLLAAFVLKAVLTVAIGALIGTGVGLFVLDRLPTGLGNWFDDFPIPPRTWWLLPALLGVLVASAQVIPTTVIVRLRPVDGREDA